MCLEWGKTFSDKSGTILSSSKLSPSQLRKLFSMLSDGTAIRQLVYQEHVSLQTALLWKRKSQKITENGGNKVLSGQVLADYAYINAPASMRKGKNRRGSRSGFSRLRSESTPIGPCSKGLAAEALQAGRTHRTRSSDMSCLVQSGHFSGCFPGCREVAVNSKDGEAHKILNPVNRLCDQVKHIFAVHLRIHRKNVWLWLSEKAFRMGHGCGLAFGKIYVSLLQSHLSGKPSEDGKSTGFSNTIAYHS